MLYIQCSNLFYCVVSSANTLCCASLQLFFRHYVAADLTISCALSDSAPCIQATHKDWDDTLVLNCSRTPTDGSAFHALITQKIEQMNVEAVSVMASMTVKRNTDSDVYGYFRRTKVADSGN